MQVCYDPQGGLLISLPVYEGEMSVKLMRLIIKEVQKQEIDAQPFFDVVLAIAGNQLRRVQ